MRTNFSYFSLRHAVCRYAFCVRSYIFSRLIPASPLSLSFARFRSLSLSIFKAFTIFLYPLRFIWFSVSSSHSLWPTAALPSLQRPYEKRTEITQKMQWNGARFSSESQTNALLFNVCVSLFIHWYEYEDKQRQQQKITINKYIWELYSNNTSFYLLCNKL